MKRRRSEDHTLRLVIAESESPPTPSESVGSDPLQWSIYEWDADSTPRLIKLSDLRPETDGRVLVLDLGGDSAILIAGASVRRIPSGTSRSDLLERASCGAAAWEAERARLWRWMRLPDLLHQFAERLNRAEEIAEVSRAVTRGVIEIVGGYHATLLLRDPPASSMFAAATRLRAIDGESLSIPTHPRLWRPGLVRTSEARADVGGPFAMLSQWLTDTEAVAFVHMPVGEEGILLLSERRSGRSFDGDDWSLLRNLASQAEGAIRRVRSLEEVKLLSLTDPLTGLANRRRLEIVMHHAWAAAKRGRNLSVVLIDLDDFKRINDEQGHHAGDRVLRTVAGVLREEARESDVVVRYGGDEFLILMPGETFTGASALIGRIQRRLGTEILISAGVAEYQPQMQLPENLLAEADRVLYEVKRQLRGRV